MSDLDLLGAEPLVTKYPTTWTRGAFAIGTGLLGALVIRSHPVLAFLNGAALASNVHAVSTGDRTAKDAIRRMGRHVVATAGALAMPKIPWLGYVAGAAAADLLIDGEGGGIIEEWLEYEGVKDHHHDIIDAEIVSDSKQALVKRGK